MCSETCAGDDCQLSDDLPSLSAFCHAGPARGQQRRLRAIVRLLVMKREIAGS